MKLQPLYFRFAALAILFTVGCFARSAAAEDGAAENIGTQAVITTGGDRFAARLSGKDENAFRFLSADGENRDVKVAELIRWGAAIDAKRGPLVLLVDGSLLAAYPMGDPLTLVDESIHVEVDTTDTEDFVKWQAKLPVDTVRGVLFQMPSEIAERDRLLDTLDDPERRTDVVFLTNGDKLEGTITALDNSELKLDSDSIEAKIDIDRIQAIAFNAALAHRVDRSKRRMIVSTADGSRFFAEEITAAAEGASAEQWQLRISGLPPVPIQVDRVVALQPLTGNVTYLSDLKPLSYRHLPLIDIEWPFHRDRSVTGSRLRAAERVFDKGLGMHSTARVTYRLDKSYRRFEAELAIDDTTKGAGSVVFRVFLDSGSGKWKPAYASTVVRGGDAPLPISVDVSKAKRMTLVVEFAERGDVQDHANWLDARLVP